MERANRDLARRNCAGRCGKLRLVRRRGQQRISSEGRGVTSGAATVRGCVVVVVLVAVCLGGVIGDDTANRSGIEVSTESSNSPQLSSLRSTVSDTAVAESTWTSIRRSSSGVRNVGKDDDTLASTIDRESRRCGSCRKEYPPVDCFVGSESPSISSAFHLNEESLLPLSSLLFGIAVYV